MGPKTSISKFVYLNGCLPLLDGDYLDRVALFTIIIVIDESAFHFVGNLPCDVGENPKPNGPKGTVYLLFRADFFLNFIVFKLPFLMELVLISQYKEDDPQRYHDSVDCQLSDF